MLNCRRSETEVNVTFPEDYHATELAGKPAHIQGAPLRRSRRSSFLNLDDEFASEVSDFDTMAEYREDVTEEADLPRRKRKLRLPRKRQFWMQ